ncbi:hypothetical protein NFC73_16175, partial [Pseudarthrobacter sp. RMG13]
PAPNDEVEGQWLPSTPPLALFRTIGGSEAQDWVALKASNTHISEALRDAEQVQQHEHADRDQADARDDACLCRVHRLPPANTAGGLAALLPSG